MKYLTMPLFVIILCSFFVYCAANTDVTDPQKSNYCECKNYNCGCCTQLHVKSVVNGRLCSNFSYLPEDIGISVTVTYNNIDIFNETISARNPPPICIIHVDEIKMEICLHFYKLDYEHGHFSGCAEFQVHFFKLLPFKKLQLGCWNTNLSYITKEIQNMTDYKKGHSKKVTNQLPTVVLV